MFHKVLVPLDGSVLAEGILPYVSQLAKGTGMSLVLLSVIDPNAVELPERLRKLEGETPTKFLPGQPAFRMITPVPSAEKPKEEPRTPVHETGGPYVSQTFDKVEIEMHRGLEGIAKRLRVNGLDVECVVTFGKAAEEIVRIAEHEDCDLIAMSTHGRSTLGRGILGSVSDKVVHTSHLPTLVITPERAKEYHAEDAIISTILLPLDGSALAETAIPYVERMAKTLSLEVLLVRVVKLGGAYAAYADGYPYAGATNIEKEIESEAVDYLKTIVQQFMAKGIKARWQLLKGAPAVCILDAAREQPQDLVVLTTHGRSGFRRWLLGSVAESLVRASGDPVLIIPPDNTNDN